MIRVFSKFFAAISYAKSEKFLAGAIFGASVAWVAQWIVLHWFPTLTFMKWLSS